MTILFLVHLISTFMMVSVIWLVQILIYPQFQNLQKTDRARYHQFHMERITWVVAPLMGLEFVTAAGLMVLAGGFWSGLNFLTVVSLWILTFFVNIPSHQVVSSGNDGSEIQLVKKNWPRTWIWTLRGLGLVGFLWLNGGLV